jgi:hypothetical protein
MLATEQKQRINKLYFKIRVVICVAACLLPALLCVFYFTCKNNYAKPELLGQLGDFIGGVLNPLFSILSLLFIAFSLIHTLMQTEMAISSNTAAIDIAIQQNKIAAEQLRLGTIQIEFEQKKHEKNSIEDSIRLRRELTITWHQNWMSPQMAAIKRSVYADIEYRIRSREAGQHSAFIGESRTSDSSMRRKEYREIKDVILRIHQAITFFDDDLLDKELFMKLFQADFKQWHSVLSRLDMRIDTSDGSQDSLSEETERRDLVERLARVIGLQETSVAS